MKFTLSWLKDHLETEATVDQIAEALTDLGLEVEEVVDPAAKLETNVPVKHEAQLPLPVHSSPNHIKEEAEAKTCFMDLCGDASALSRALNSVLEVGVPSTHPRM